MEKLLVKNYGIEIKLPSFVNIIGLPGSGKTHLLKMLINRIPNEEVYLNEKCITEFELDFKKKNITCCLDLNFNTKYVKEELVYYQELCSFSVKEAFDKLDALEEYFDLEGIINEKISALSIYDKALVKILSLLALSPLIIGIDNFLSYVDEKYKHKIVKYAKENKITIINVTSDKEELLIGTDIIILENKKVKSMNKTKAVLSDEKLLSTVGFELPFVLTLSNGLNLYGLIKNKCYDLKSLVGATWK